jgi:hypothetical protein
LLLLILSGPSVLMENNPILNLPVLMSQQR